MKWVGSLIKSGSEDGIDVCLLLGGYSDFNWLRMAIFGRGLPGKGLGWRKS